MADPKVKLHAKFSPLPSTHHHLLATTIQIFKHHMASISEKTMLKAARSVSSHLLWGVCSWAWFEGAVAGQVTSCAQTVEGSLQLVLVRIGCRVRAWARSLKHSKFKEKIKLSLNTCVVFIAAASNSFTVKSVSRSKRF